jgi:hypothetical protein
VIPSPQRAPRDDALIACYEELRQQALGPPCAIPRGQGLALLMRSGIAGWMQAWAQCVATVAAPPKERPGDDAIFPFEMHREVTLILAGMVLNGRQEAIA